MKPINIYALTRISEPSRLAKLERQMSGRKKYLKIKAWELDGLRSFCEKLDAVMENAAELNFYYSFVMPKLGKEFDLLGIGEDCVVNVELKSGSVTDEAIKRQLLQNRYYLATLGKTMYFYTYVSSTDKLFRLSSGGRLLEADWTHLADVLRRQGPCHSGHIEELFREEKYLISPLTDPDRFLRGEYFLTSQQMDIKKQILRNLKRVGSGQAQEREVSVQGFTGFPGTGKTILLYDIAMQLSRRERVCLFHLGPHTRELDQLDKRLKRIDFYYDENMEEAKARKPYFAIFVDEGHRLTRATLSHILTLAGSWRAPVIVSYDREDALAPEERELDGAGLIEAVPGYVRYHLTNRIRLNHELSSFIRCVMCAGNGNHRSEYPSVSLAYATSRAETDLLLHNFKQEGYIYIWDAALGRPGDAGDEHAAACMPEHGGHAATYVPEGGAPDVTAGADRSDPDRGDIVEATKTACKEYARVVMLIDRSFAYDAKGYLRSMSAPEAAERQSSAVRNLFHGLSRAKERIAIVVEENEPVFERLLSIVQR